MLVPLTVGAGILTSVVRKRRFPERAARPLKGLSGVDAAVAALDEAHLRARFQSLAPEFRMTHAGYGKPRWTSDHELQTFMSNGLVERVKEAHISAGMLDVYKLTDLGRRVHSRLRQSAPSTSVPSSSEATSSG